MSVEVTAITVTIVLAFIGYAATYVNDLRLARRKDRLDRVNRQLSELYGPLLALSTASSRLWEEFTALHAPPRSGAFWNRHRPPTVEQTDAWRLWMTTVFMPLNVQMRNAIIDHADLLHDSDGMPNSFLDLCAHVAGYETVLEPWRSGNFDPSDYRDNTSVVNFPAAELGGYVHDAYHELRLEQETLLQGLGLAGRR